MKICPVKQKKVQNSSYH